MKISIYNQDNEFMGSSDDLLGTWLCEGDSFVSMDTVYVKVTGKSGEARRTSLVNSKGQVILSGTLKYEKPASVSRVNDTIIFRPGQLIYTPLPESIR